MLLKGLCFKGKSSAVIVGCDGRRIPYSTSRLVSVLLNVSEHALTFPLTCMLLGKFLDVDHLYSDHAVKAFPQMSRSV